jgi:16S rRNA processing protein RimM
VSGEAEGRTGLVEIARVVRARGLAGELVVHTHAEDPQLLLGAEQVMLEGRPGAIPYRVRERRPLKQLRDGRWLVGLCLVGIAERRQAELWVPAALQIPAQQLEAARGEDWYWRDLIGLECRGAGGELIGRVREIWPRPSQDLLVIERPGGGELLVPAADEVLRRVDLASGQLWIDLPEAAGSAR